MNEKELYEITLNNADGADVLNESDENYAEKTIYTMASTPEEAAEKFAAHIEEVMSRMGYNDTKPLTLWLFHRVHDGFEIP